VPVPTPALGSEQLTLAGRTVLVIEDRKDSRELVTAILLRLEAHVLTAGTVEQAMHEVRVCRPHLIVSDIKLPDGTGIDFMKWLRTQPRGARIPSIAITAWGNHFPPQAAGDFDAYMQKPLDFDRFSALAVSLAYR
jgi:two-component system, NtrC family, response regulator PilR